MTHGDTVVCFPFVGDAVGGSHLSALLLIDALGTTSYRPLVVVHRVGPLVDELDRRGTPWVLAPGPEPFGTRKRIEQAGRAVLTLPSLASFLRREDIAIVHTNDSRIHRTWGLAARLARCRHVWHQRNAGLSAKMAALARLADASLTVSHFARSTLPRELARRTLVIDNPFEPSPEAQHREKHRRVLVEELGCRPGSYVVGFVAEYIPRKRPVVFIEVAELLLREHALEAVFPMFGRQTEPTATIVRERVTKAGLDEAVHHLGFRAPVDPWLAACDLLIAPYEAEPFSRTIVEAMLLGTPVVASNEGGNPEIIVSDELGALASGREPQALAAAAALLLTDPQRRRDIAARAQRAAASRYSTSRHVGEISAVYDRLLAAPKARRASK